MSEPAEKVAVLSTDANPIYSLLAPLTAYLWKELVGYTPFVYLIGNVPPFVIEKTKEAGAVVQHVSVPKGRWPGRIAMDIRLFAAREEHFSPETYLLTTDADLWPLQRDYFQCLPDWEKDFHVFNALGMSPKESEYPLCYLGARRRVWNEILGESTIEESQSFLREQIFITGRIKAWSGHPGRVQKLERPLDKRWSGHHMRYTDRIDKRWWRDLRSGDVDCHLLRDRTDAKWDALSALIAQLGKSNAWTDDYLAAARALDLKR